MLSSCRLPTMKSTLGVCAEYGFLAEMLVGLELTSDQVMMSIIQ